MPGGPVAAAQLWCMACALTSPPGPHPPQAGSEPLTPRSEASDVSGMSAEARAYLERHLANIARGRGGLVPAHVQAQLGEGLGREAGCWKTAGGEPRGCPAGFGLASCRGVATTLSPTSSHIFAPFHPCAAEHHSIHGGRGKHGLWGMGSTLVLHNKRRWGLPGRVLQAVCLSLTALLPRMGPWPPFCRSVMLAATPSNAEPLPWPAVPPCHWANSILRRH